ncbi:MAG: DUF2080 family transposase-associated protein [Nanoarchaeota archaeon]|mgnify:FL=1
MEIQKLAVKEQIVKTVVRSGNGGAVWVPKGWLGQEVVVILPEKPKFKLKERIIHLLEPYLKDIISVGLYGSYARNEHTKESDVDVLVITKDKSIKLDFKEEKLDIVSLPIDRLQTAIQKYPTLYYQMVLEAAPLINAYVFEELKNTKINKESFKNYIKETREHIKSNEELLELDKIDNAYLKSYSVLFSSILRLRGLFIMKCILKKYRFSNKRFKNWLVSKGLNLSEFEDSYKAYRLIRDNEDTKSLKIKINVAEKILIILENESGSLEAQINGK